MEINGSSQSLFPGLAFVSLNAEHGLGRHFGFVPVAKDGDKLGVGRGVIHSLSSLLALDIAGEHPVLCSLEGCCIATPCYLSVRGMLCCTPQLFVQQSDTSLQTPQYFLLGGALLQHSHYLFNRGMLRPKLPVIHSRDGCSVANSPLLFAGGMFCGKPSIICSRRDAVFQTPSYLLKGGMFRCKPPVICSLEGCSGSRRQGQVPAYLAKL